MYPIVTYFFRHPRPEYHSIERLFGGLAQHQNRQSGQTVAQQVRCPHSRITPLNLLRNCLYARRRRGNINHITGDVHYLALVLPKRSTILTIHDCVLLTRYPTWHPMHWLHYYVWYKWPIGRAGVVTTISDKSKAELVQLTGTLPVTIQVIPNFCDPRFSADKQAVPQQTKPVILQVGTGTNKNLDRLVVAVAGLVCRLVIVGELTQSQLDLLQGHQIDFQSMTNVDFETLRHCYATASLVTFVSLYEGFGLPILEAQAMKVPVLTSDKEPMRTIAGRGAALVDPTNLTAMRAGIKRILANDAYRNELIEAGQRNMANYTIERVSAQYTALYASLAP